MTGLVYDVDSGRVECVERRSPLRPAGATGAPGAAGGAPDVPGAGAGAEA